MNYAHSTVSAYLLKCKGQADTLISFFKAMQSSQKKCAEEIINIFKDKTQLESLKQIKDKSIKKKIDNFSIHDIEKKQSEKNIDFINGKIMEWLKEAKEQFQSINQDLRALQLKKHKKTQTQQDVKQFKDKLKKVTIQFARKKYDILKVAAKHLIKNQCEVVESLTSLMQSHQDQLKKQPKKL